MRYLVYFTVSGPYVELARYCMHTLRSFPENDTIDILVLSDSVDVGQNDLPVDFFHVTQANADGIQTSMRKLDVFSWPGISSYAAVLYLDSDIVVGGPLLPLFAKITDPARVYVVPEGSDHTSPYYHCKDRPYTPIDLEWMRSRGLRPFNAGQFGFIPSAAMRSDFAHISYRTKEYDASLHFYEQSFMNDHLNRKGAVCYDLEPYVALDAMKGGVSTDVLLAHFCNAAVPAREKMRHMKALHRSYITNWPKVRVVDSRNQMKDVTGSCRRIVEIGTFQGDFARILLDTYQPERLFLIDPWERGIIQSGDANGNNVVSRDGEEMHEKVVKEFESKGNVRVYRCKSDEMHMCNVDLVYIDGDHSYEGVVRDLNLAWTWVRRGGWICGHDVAINPARTDARYDFGTRKAVEDFCTERGLRVHALMVDGCVSFAIRK